MSTSKQSKNKDYAKLHKELWTWLAANPGKSKTHWPRWERNGGDVPKVAASCFACESSSSSILCNCTKCPIKMSVTNELMDSLGFKIDKSFCLNGLYGAWLLDDRDATAATAIANLEWVER